MNRNPTSNCRLGPVQSATIVCQNLSESISAYRNFLGLEVKLKHRIDGDWAKRWQSPKLEGLRFALLGHKDEQDWWLRLIEDPFSRPPTALATVGWMSLEINVRDVDKLLRDLNDSYFTLIGAPADLEMSNNIRAMQIKGAAGEVLYITTIKAPCPPFELPITDREIDRIFIPVLSTHSRELSLNFYQNLANRTGLSFDTKITVLNRQFGKSVENQYPIATLQLNQNNLIEIDQVSEQISREIAPCGLPPGIALLSFYQEDCRENFGSLLVGSGAELLEIVRR